MDGFLVFPTIWLSSANVVNRILPILHLSFDNGRCAETKFELSYHKHFECNWCWIQLGHNRRFWEWFWKKINPNAAGISTKNYWRIFTKKNLSENILRERELFIYPSSRLLLWEGVREREIAEGVIPNQVSWHLGSPGLVFPKNMWTDSLQA